jgi:hypothetical protein
VEEVGRDSTKVGPLRLKPHRHQKLCRSARLKVEEKFTLQVQARAYKNLYEEILQAANGVDRRKQG